jgi:hypothetical protein
MTERSKKQNGSQTNEKTPITNTSSRSWSSCKCIFILLFSIVLPILFTGYISFNINNLQKLDPIKYYDIIPNAPSYKWFRKVNFFSDNTVKLFTEMFLSGETFSTVIEENNSQNVESAGEAVEIGHVCSLFLQHRRFNNDKVKILLKYLKLDCKHPFMTLNLNRTMCHFSNRLGKLIFISKTFKAYV